MMAENEAEQKASEWLVARAAGDLDADPAAQSRFRDWLAASPENARALERQQAVWNALPGMAHLAALKDEPALEAAPTPAPAPLRHRLPWRPIGAGVTALAATLIAALMLRSPEPQPAPKPLPTGDYATRIAELRRVTLPDGSQVTLGAASAIDIDFSATQRRVTLAAGDAFFDVAHDKARPFVVASGDMLVRVVGTKFAVHRGALNARVTVEQGIVEVSRPQAATAPMRLTAGQQAVVTPPAPAVAPQIAVAPIAPEDVAAWRDGRLVYQDAYLRDIVADANRYYPGTIHLAEPALGNRQLSISFRTDQIPRMIEVLTASLPLDVEPGPGQDIVLRRRSGSLPERG